MKNLYPEIKRGFAPTLLKVLITIAAFIAAWQYGLLDKLLPQDLLTWVWVGTMISLFGWSLLRHAMPYQNRIDQEVKDFRTVMEYLYDNDRTRFKQLFDGTPFLGASQSSVAKLFQLISRQGSLPADIREPVNLDNLVGYVNESDALSSKVKSLIWYARDILTLGIIGTYVGISIGVLGSDAIIAGDTEETRAFVAYLFSSIGLALLTTLVGLVAGSLFLTKLHEQAQVNFHRVLNELSVELPTTGYMGWVNKGRPEQKSAGDLPPKEE